MKNKGIIRQDSLINYAEKTQTLFTRQWRT